ncbi:hypothetical protein [Aequorivita vladivostokensis]|uniref:Polysaccharide polymerase n=1 Tax=Aequorivita vladivostokensis TaxID=171194 RepID=A0ABR5DJB7_9FLAO|nr:hypothetical protein [Aequorivita vladivostokensis]KJJ38847.1 hypothetical protein MB09_05215 [Aequorivita vladivostokensis]
MTYNVSYFILIGAIILSALQYSSIGIGGNNYILFRTLIIALMGLLFLFNFRGIINSFVKNSFIKIHLGVTTLTTFCLILFWGMVGDVDFGIGRDLWISLTFLSIGYNFDFDEKKFLGLIYLFILSNTLAAFSLVAKFASGFVVEELYWDVPKNQIAPVFGIAFLLSLYFLFYKSRKVNWILLLLSALLLLSIIVLRGRAVILGCLICSFIFLFTRIRKNKYIILLPILLIPVIPYLYKLLIDSLFLNYDSTNINSLSSGRYNTYTEAFHFFVENPFFGQQGQTTLNGGIIHNYVLYALVSYGLMVSFFILILYFKYFKLVIKSMIKPKPLYYESGVFVFALFMLVSLFEYTFPFGPGSAVFFPFLLLGFYIKKNEYAK